MISTLDMTHMCPKGHPKTSKKTALYLEVAETLRQQIYDQILGPGEWIDELKLLEHLKISRTPLRESLKLLAAEGLVQIKPGQGCFVTRITIEELNELFPVMSMLEGRCAHEAAKKIRAQDLDLLEKLHREMGEKFNDGDLKAYYALNYEFHEKVQNMSRNPWLIRVTNDLRRILRMYRGQQLQLPGRLAESMSEHNALMDCFRSKNVHEAERIMSEHIQHQREALMKFLTSQGQFSPSAMTHHS
jgi:DNA-binding GntR family transcriptional regulator